MRLRELVTGDLDAFYEHQADREASDLAGIPTRDREAFDPHWQELLADPQIVIRTVEVDVVDERPLRATVAPANAASIRVLEKNGFRLLREEPDTLVFEFR